jgi:deoxyribodipyrimidine photolyase-related protein
MNSKSLVIILADQLFEFHPCYEFLEENSSKDIDFVMVESISEAKKRSYHKFKLAYLYTCMREYRDFLIQKLKGSKNKLFYYDLVSNIEKHLDFESIITGLVLDNNYDKIEIITPNNKPFRKKILQIVNNIHKNTQLQNKTELCFLDNPMFLNTYEENKEYFNQINIKRDSHKSINYKMSDFYIQQRKKLNILVKKDGEELKPVGGKWSYDLENRQKLSSDVEIPKRKFNYQNQNWYDVKTLIDKYFTSNPGTIPELFLPINFVQTKQCLYEFLNNYLADYGTFQDSLTTKDNWVFHSLLSAPLNYGLITPAQILKELKKIELTTPINSLEGFIRQIIGWREFMKAIYDCIYEDNLAQYNFFNAQNPLPEYFWKLNTDIEDNLPLQIVLQKNHIFAYNHHIERLMILSNWCLLNEYNPLEVLEWFNSMYVDAFEWVMMGNVLGMGLFADGGIFATKPYLSGGNYILKMSDFAKVDKNKSKIWNQEWTDLFWKFLIKHQEYFQNNPRMSMLIKSKKTKSD